MEKTLIPKTTIEFDKSKITKVYKDQKEPLSGKFTDEIFPPNDNSFLGTNSSNEYLDPTKEETIKKYLKPEEVEWKRATEIFPKPTIFEGSFSFDDIYRGRITNTYFLSSLSSMCNLPGLINQIFLTKEYNENTSLIKLIRFIDGEFQIVLLDDYFPVIKGTNIPFFLRTSTFGLWAILLEKAFAKVCGGYGNIILGWPKEIFRTFTGFSTEDLIHDENTINHLWEVINSVCKNNSLVISFSREDENLEKKGLIQNHGYIILHAQEINKKRLCVIKTFFPGDNPYNGECSLASDFWTDDVKKQVSNPEYLESDDDSLSWITIEDLKENFMKTDICHIITDGKVKSYDINDDVDTPKIYNIYIQKGGMVSINIYGETATFHPENINRCQPTSLIIAEYDPNDYTIKHVFADYNSNGDAMKTRNLRPGYYIVWAYRPNNISDEPKSSNPSYKVRFISNVPINIKEMGNDKDFLVLSEIICGGVKHEAKDQIKDDEVYYETGNSFRGSGIAYRISINPKGTLYQIVECDTKDIQNVILLPPYNDKETFTCSLGPKSISSILAIKRNYYGDTCLKLNPKGKQYECREGEKPVEENRIKPELFMSNDTEKTETVFDYETPSKETLLNNIEYPSIDHMKSWYDKLKEKYPIIMEEINKMKPGDDDQDDLEFMEIETDEGIYVGEGNFGRKEGRGGYIFKTGENKDYIWVGYWEDDERGKFGKLYNDKGKLIYEGDYNKDLREGEGTYYYNTGEKYVGEWVNGLREGNGVLYWKDGSKWEGVFHNNLMDGEGMFSDGVDTFPVVYKEGNIVNE